MRSDAQKTSQSAPPESALGGWRPAGAEPVFDGPSLAGVIERVREPVLVVRDRTSGRIGAAQGGSVEGGDAPYDLLASLPPLYPEWLGDRGFGEVHGVRFPYVAGAMANGIATVELVVAMARAGMLGFFGAAGLSYGRVEEAVDRLVDTLGDDSGAWGVNLIHSPNEPKLEARVAAMLVERGVRRVSASAYMRLTPAVVHYAYAGLHIGEDGAIARPHHVFAKISRAEVAEAFMRPAPARILDKLVDDGRLTASEAELARRLPVAEDITVEADSGGHTDNRPLGALLPEIMRLRDRVTAEEGYERPIRVGAAGGLGTPTAVASAFALGAAYVLTGSVNQAAVESGLSQAGKEMLAHADLTDVVMAPAADMFELGVELQVLKRGTMFGQRARKLWELYKTYDALEALPDEVRTHLEQKILGATVDEVWEQTRSFWAARDPEELTRAEGDPRHKMALVFRWYLGQSSRWAIAGDPERRFDYQIWCGPAMGAFNSWVEDSFLEEPGERFAAQIARNLLEGAAVITRAHQLRSYGVAVPPEAFLYEPRPLQ